MKELIKIIEEFNNKYNDNSLDWETKYFSILSKMNQDRIIKEFKLMKIKTLLPDNTLGSIGTLNKYMKDLNQLTF